MIAASESDPTSGRVGIRSHERTATPVGTGDILLAAIRFYGADFDCVLAAHGTDRDEVIARLAA